MNTDHNPARASVGAEEAVRAASIPIHRIRQRGAWKVITTEAESDNGDLALVSLAKLREKFDLKDAQLAAAVAEARRNTLLEAAGIADEVAKSSGGNLADGARDARNAIRAAADTLPAQGAGNEEKK